MYVNHKLAQHFPSPLEPPAAILVVGGGNANVELVDLTEGGAESCISPVLATNFRKNTAGVWVDEKPTVCGGGDYYGDDSLSDECYSYEMEDGSWFPVSNLLGIR